METAKIGVKETMDVLVWVRELVTSLAEHASDDGKVDGFEITRTLLGSTPSAMAAFTGISEISRELKDLDLSEKERIMSEAVGIVLLLARTFYKGEKK